MSWTLTAKQSVKDKGFFDKDSDYDGMLGKALTELIDTFSNQGHSGASAQRIAELFYKLVVHGGFFSEEDHNKAIEKLNRKRKE